jgi:hypothetical protein
MTTITRWMVLLAAFLLSIAGPIFAQAEGPIAAPPKFEVKRIASVPTPGPPPIPLPQLLQQVAKNEDAIQQAYSTYTFEQSIIVNELPGPTDTGGDFTVTDKISHEPDGERRERVLKPAVSTLKRAYLLRFEVDTFASVPFFILTTAQLANYNVTFEGDETLDEIHAYILRVQPKQIERAAPRFDGVVWVDDHDLAIVKSYGRFITDVAQSESMDHPFQEFEIYRENIMGHLWFPTYVDSDSVISLQDGELHLRLVMRSTNFQLAAMPGHPGQEQKASSPTPSLVPAQSSAPASGPSSAPPTPSAPGTAAHPPSTSFPPGKP